ncbi:hypothetical protein PVT71_05685 [Salipiger sp. H15]|uniref:Flagellar FliJ protein n=1 Tax=Alloyangia sp. H15 TaxID=3029062 RepID=A0AAU8AIQ1_9RHOB
MTVPDAELLRVSEVLRDRALARFRRDLEAEARLGAERERIDALRRAALAEAGAFGAHQITGMSGLWQGELLRRRAAIQLGIAEARARQGYSGAAARADFSRDAAARALAEAARAARAAKRLAAEERALEELAVLRLWLSGDRG